MSDHVYRVVEVVGSSSDSTDAAVENAIARTNETVRNVEWFEVVETRGHVENGAIAHYQVTVKVGFRVEPGDAV
ncbi:dodecin [Rhodococcus sp. NM-2]|jgi:flavin-binding protein dodecin|uniref:dodecin n=1 Tax=Rhodococcus TaxID=1827 RepID=UPI002476A653|nr:MULTISPECIES: dodecin [Rhodococcus]MDH6292707.1 flavin-binding protein dodecin [Rhodococcus opacus]MDI9972495.1 dodecin family protein [Rhodococcus sp. IEGM 1307]